jgi:folate-binding protein YgfZ
MKSDYQTLTEAVGILRLDSRELVEISGSDSLSFLHKMTTNDFESLAIGDGCEAFATNAQGKIQGFFAALKRADSVWLEMAVGQADSLVAHLDMYVIREDVKFKKLEALGAIAIVGPALNELAAAAGWEVPTSAWSHLDLDIEGESVVVVQAPWLGSQAIEVFGSRESLESIERKLAELAPVCDPSLAEVLRIENGFPDFGKDISTNNLPQELARDDIAISFTKGCYIGQETVARIDSLGRVNKLLVQLRFPAGDAPAIGTELLREQKVVGQITSVAMSPGLAAPIALGIVRRQEAAVGTELESSAGVVSVVDLAISTS